MAEDHGSQRLLERKGELDLIASVLDAGGRGLGGARLIQGPAGIGKSELLASAGVMARERGFQVLTGRGHRLEQDFPYGVVRQLLEPELVRASKIDPELLQGAAGRAHSILRAEPEDRPASGAVGGEEVSFAVLHGLYWFSANLAERQPLFLSVDDLHWADGPSIRFFLYMARRLEQLPIVLVLAQRQGEGAEDLFDELTADRSVGLTRLQPLSPQAVGELIEHWCGPSPDAAFVTACHRATGGNPFLLKELILSLGERRLPPTAESAGQIERMRPPTVSRAVMRRLRQLPAEAAELARAVSILGPGTTLVLAGELVGLPVADTAVMTDLLVRTEILRPGSSLDFVHPIVGAAIYDEVPAGMRPILHGSAARLLASHDAGIDKVASHLLEAEPLGDEWAVGIFREAAAQAIARGAPQSSVAYLRRALIEPPPPSAKAHLLLELGRAETDIDPESAVTHLREALDSTEELRERASIDLALLRAVLHVGTVEIAVDEVRSCIEALGDQEPELALRLEAELISVLRQCLATSPLADESIERWRGRLVGATPSERLMLIQLAALNGLKGASASTVAEMAEQALGDGLLLSDQSSGSFLFFLPMYQLICADRFEEAETHLDQGAKDAEIRGSPLGFANVSCSRSILAFARGNLRDAEAEARSAVIESERFNWYGLPLAIDGLVNALVGQGRLDEADEILEKHGLSGVLPDAVSYRILLGTRGSLRLAQSRDQEACEDFLDIAEREKGRGPSNLFHNPYRPLAAVALGRLGLQDAAQSMIGDSLVRARNWGSPRVLASTLRIAASLKEGEEALELLHEAVRIAEKSQALLVRAHCEVDYGSTLRRLGRRSDALPWLRRGLDLASRCFAAPLVDRAREELTVLGARPRRTAITGVDALTASERRVADLACQGLTNRKIAESLFVTIRTVELHLTHTYQKLGIGTREELPAATGSATG